MSNMKISIWPPLPFISIIATGTKVDPPGETFGPRKQWSYEFIWMRSGFMTARINMQKVKGIPGTLLLVPPGVTDTYNYSKTERSIHSFIHFNLRLPHQGWPSPPSWPLFRHLPPEHTLFHLFRQVLAFSPLSDKCYLPVLGPTVELILRYYLLPGKLDVSEAEAEPGLSGQVERALYWLREKVHNRPLKKIRLSDLARAAFTSPQNLCRLFRKDLQIRPMECARLLKIEYAGVFLERSQMTVKEVSNLCGFENPFHFSRLFKEVYGIPPQAYREGFKKKGLVRPASPIFRKYESQRIRFNNLLGPPAVSFQLLPKKYKMRLK